MKTMICVAIVWFGLIFYMIYLDWGCELNGVMTWDGKQCVEDIKN